MSSPRSRPGSAKGRLDMVTRVSTENAARIERLNAEPGRTPPRVPSPVSPMTPEGAGEAEAPQDPATAPQDPSASGSAQGSDAGGGSPGPASAQDPEEGSRPSSASRLVRTVTASDGRPLWAAAADAKRILRVRTAEKVEEAQRAEEELLKGHTLCEACVHCWSQPAVVLLYLLFLGIFLTSALYAKADIEAADHDCGACKAVDGCHPTLYKPAFRMVNHTSYYTSSVGRMAAHSGITGREIPGDLFVSYACDGEYIMTCYAKEGDDDAALYEAFPPAGSSRRRLHALTTATNHYWTSFTCDLDGDTAAHRRALGKVGESVPAAQGGALTDALKPAKPGVLGYWPATGYSTPLWRSLAEATGQVAGENQCPHALDWGNSVTTVTFALACILFLTFAIEHTTELVHETVRFFREEWVSEIIGILLKELCLLGIGSITVSIINEASILYDLTAEQYHILHLVHNGVFIFAVCYISLSVTLVFLTTRWMKYVGDKVNEDEKLRPGYRPGNFDAESASLFDGPWSTQVLRTMEQSFERDLGLTEDFDFVKYATYFAQESCAHLVELKESAWIIFLGFLLVNLVRYKTVSLPASTMIITMGVFQLLLFVMLLWILYDTRLGAFEHLRFRAQERDRHEAEEEKKALERKQVDASGSRLTAAQRFKRAVNVIRISGYIRMGALTREIVTEADRVTEENHAHQYSAQIIARPELIYHLLQLAIFYTVITVMGAVYYSFYVTSGASIVFLVIVWLFILLILSIIVLDWSSLVFVNSMVEIKHAALEHVLTKTYEPDPEQNEENREMAEKVVAAVEEFCSDQAARVSVESAEELDAIVAANMPSAHGGHGHH